MLESDDPPHVYMFTGMSGCGKTTLARIIANELGCDEIREINAANFNGIEYSRKMISESRFKGNRCWIIDEAQQLTAPAQDALLKLFEDGPSNCYYILCTTDPKKIKATIKNRCSKYEVAPLSNSDMEDLLAYIIDKEQSSIIDEAMDYIIEQADGSSRQALVLLEQIINLEEDQQLDCLENFKGLESQVIDLCRALSRKGSKFKECAKLAQALPEDPEKIRRAVMMYYANTLVKTGMAQHRHIVDCFSDNYYDTGKAGLICSIYDVFD